MQDGRLIGVVGARGGLGASTVAAALARRLARGAPARRGLRRSGGEAPGGPGARPPTTTALADLDGAGGGLDVLLGVEAMRGLRWPDLHGARGEVSGTELTALLPRWSGVTVLSGDRARPGAPPAEIVADVLAALASCHDQVVLDLDRQHVLTGPSGPPAVPQRCAVVLVVAGRDLRSVAGVLALRTAGLAGVPDVRLVVRGPAPGGLGVLELAHVVDLPVAASLSPEPGLDAVLERGGGPVLAHRSSLARAVDRLASDLG